MENTLKEAKYHSDWAKGHEPPARKKGSELDKTKDPLRKKQLVKDIDGTETLQNMMKTDIFKRKDLNQIGPFTRGNNYVRYN